MQKIFKIKTLLFLLGALFLSTTPVEAPNVTVTPEQLGAVLQQINETYPEIAQALLQIAKELNSGLGVGTFVPILAAVLAGTFVVVTIINNFYWERTKFRLEQKKFLRDAESARAAAVLEVGKVATSDMGTRRLLFPRASVDGQGVQITITNNSAFDLRCLSDAFSNQSCRLIGLPAAIKTKDRSVFFFDVPDRAPMPSKLAILFSLETSVDTATPRNYLLLTVSFQADNRHQCHIKHFEGTTAGNIEEEMEDLSVFRIAQPQNSRTRSSTITSVPSLELRLQTIIDNAKFAHAFLTIKPAVITATDADAATYLVQADSSGAVGLSTGVRRGPTNPLSPLVASQARHSRTRSAGGSAITSASAEVTTRIAGTGMAAEGSHIVEIGTRRAPRAELQDSVHPSRTRSSVRHPRGVRPAAVAPAEDTSGTSTTLGLASETVTAVAVSTQPITGS
jgi:hypothetical protein